MCPLDRSASQWRDPHKEPATTSHSPTSENSVYRDFSQLSRMYFFVCHSRRESVFRHRPVVLQRRHQNGWTSLCPTQCVISTEAQLSGETRMRNQQQRLHSPTCENGISQDFSQLSRMHFFVCHSLTESVFRHRPVFLQRRHQTDGHPFIRDNVSSRPKRSAVERPA
jgi:hypothetical protein